MYSPIEVPELHDGGLELQVAQAGAALQTRAAHFKSRLAARTPPLGTICDPPPHARANSGSGVRSVATDP